MANTVIGIYIIRPEDAEACDPPSDVGLIVEGVKVLQNLGDVTKACALLLGVIYSLNLSYPSDLKYTFEFFQKVLLGLDGQKLSQKIQVLKNKLVGWTSKSFWTNEKSEDAFFFFLTFKLFLVLKLGASFNVIFVDGTTIWNGVLQL